MKISSVSKKVLASALSAAMVVAFAPTVAFGAGSTPSAVNTYTNALTGAQHSVTYYDADMAITAALTPQTYAEGTAMPAGTFTGDKATVKLSEDTTLTAAIADASASKTALTIDLNGFTLKNTNGTAPSNLTSLTFTGEGTIASGSWGDVTFAKGSKVTVTGGTFGTVTVTDAALTVDGGTFGAVPTISEANGTTIDGSGSVVVKGGTITAANDDAKALLESYVPTGYVLTGAASPYTIVATSVTCTAMDEAGTMAQAVTAANAATVDATITLGSDITVADLAALGNANGKAITVDGAGYTINGDIDVLAGAKVTFKNVTIKGDVDAYDYVYTEAKLGDTVAGKTFYKDTNGSAATKGAVPGNDYNDDGSKITAIANKLYTREAKAMNITFENVTAPVAGKTLEAKTIKSGTYKSNVVVNAIEDGTFSGTVTQTAVAIPNSTKKTAIAGGTFSGAVTSENITGGTFTGAVSDGGTSAISGGTFTKNVTADEITGGTFSNSATVATIKANYDKYDNGDKTSTVKVGIGASKVALTAAADNKAVIVDTKDVAKKAIAEQASGLFASLLDETGATSSAMVIDGRNATISALTAGTQMKVAVALTAHAVPGAVTANTTAADKALYTAKASYAFDTAAQLAKNADSTKIVDVTDLGTAVTYKVNITDYLNKGTVNEKTNFKIVKVAKDGTLSQVASEQVEGSDATNDPGQTYLTFSASEQGATYAVVAESVYQNALDKIDENEQAAKDQLALLQDEIAVLKAKGAAKTVKLGKATKTKKAQTVTLKAVKSASGATMTFKKASGSKYITVKGTKATLKKGVKKGTYTAKVTATVGASSETVTVKFVVKK